MKAHYKLICSDLDGTLIKTVSGKDFPDGIFDMKLRFGVLNAIKKLDPDYFVIVSNQGGIENGDVDLNDWKIKAEYVAACVKEYCNIPAVSYQFCSSNDKFNPRRKPNCGMIRDAVNQCSLHPDMEDILMIGDASGEEDDFSDSDFRTAENYGCDYADADKLAKGL